MHNPPSKDQLPPLRHEVRFLGWRDVAGGQRIGLIHDPLGHRFLQLTAKAGQLLTHWHLGSRSELLKQVQQDGISSIQSNDLDALITLLDRQNLLQNSTTSRNASRAKTPLIGILSKPLFIRIPLFNPDRMTAALLPLFGGLFNPIAQWILLLLGGFTGLVMMQSSGELFNAVPRFFTFSGLLAFMVTVVLSKLVHEFGHALAAKRVGCTVPSMGVAFAMGLPLAFTDVTDSWHLPDRWQRLQVALGGVVAESWLALVASWGWLILPDGLSRDLCLLLALGGWLATLVVNLNPFMRFDGYHILSDLTGITNLHSRAAALGRRLLRRTLLGWSTSVPELLNQRWRLGLALFGWLTWLVRAVIYIGLALMVYHLLAKIAGLLLSLLAIGLLLMTPILRELRLWWLNRREIITTPGLWWRLPIMIGMVIWLVWPWSHDIHLPAVVTPLERQWIHPPRPAQLVSFPALKQETIQQGETLAIFSDPALEQKIIQSKGRLTILSQRQDQALSTQSGTRERLAIKQKLAQEQSTLDGLLNQKAALTITAPFSGQLTEADPGLRTGLWMNTSQPLFLLVNPVGTRLWALVEDNDLPLLTTGQSALFHPESGVGPRPHGTITAISTVPLRTLPDPMLSSNHGGPIPTEQLPDGTRSTIGGYYSVEIHLQEPLIIQHLIRGTVVIQGKAVSLAGLFMDRVRMMLLREWTF